MAIYELTEDQFKKLDETSFASMGVKERSDLQRLLRTQFEVVSPETLIISEEFGNWDKSKRRIDLLGLDKEGNLIVVELKRTEDGGHMELQAIRNAAMVSTMTFDEAVEALEEFFNRVGNDADARDIILDFLEWDEPDEDRFAQAVRILLVSAEFGKELTTAVLWLNEQGLDIRCIRMKPYNELGRVFVDIQQVIPLPEAAEFQIRVKEKTQKEKRDRTQHIDFTKYNISIGAKNYHNLAKRAAIFRICKKLCESGTKPERILEIINWRPTRVWRSVDGHLGSEEFIAAVEAARREENLTFNPRRWFCAEVELIYSDNRTYAFSNQWGGANWLRAMEALKAAFPDEGIDFFPEDR